MKLHLVLPTLLLLAAAMFAAEPMRLRAVAVIDGDTFVGSKDARVVRLWGVDAPELDQPKGDSWGRLVAIARRGKEIDIGLELIKMGLAWHDPRYAPKAKEYAEAEAEARKAKRGLWSDDKPVSPWDWRKQQYDDTEEDD